MTKKFKQQLKQYLQELGLNDNLDCQLPDVITPGSTPNTTGSQYDQDMKLFVNASACILIGNQSLDFIFYKRHWFKPNEILGHYSLKYSQIKYWKASDKEDLFVILFNTGSLLLCQNKNIDIFKQHAGQNKEYPGTYRELYNKLLKLEDQTKN